MVFPTAKYHVQAPRRGAGTSSQVPVDRGEVNELSHCPGCGSNIGTPPNGVHVFGCGFEGERGEQHDYYNEGRKNQWSREDQNEIMAEALRLAGLDPDKADKVVGRLRKILLKKSEHEHKHPVY